MIETAIKEDLILDKKLIIPKNKLDAIRIMNELHPVVGGQPTHEKDQPNDNNPILDLACTLANIHASGVGEHADLRSIQNESPKYFYGKGFMSGISSLKGNGILVVFGQWRDASGRYAIKQFYYTDKEISYRNAVSDTAWSGWIDVLTGNSSLDYNKLLNVPLTSTLSDDKAKIASIFAVNNINRTAVNAQKTANTANANAVDAMNEAKKKVDPKDVKSESLKNSGLYTPGSNLVPKLEAGMHGLAMASSFLANNDGLDFADYPNTFLHYYVQANYHNSKTRLVCFFNGYGNGEWYISSTTNEGVWKQPARFYSTENTKKIKGFLRASGNLIPLTEDQLTSSLSDSKINPASIFIVNEVNRDVVIAQKTANTADAKAVAAQARADAAFTKVKPIIEGGTGATSVATARTNLGLKSAAVADLTSTLSDDKNLAASIFTVNEVNRKVVTAQTTANNADAKAVTAQKRADAAFSRVKPITEGGTGATTAANARENLELKGAATRDVASSLNSAETTLVPINLLKDNMSKYALLEFGNIKNNTTSTIKSPFGTEQVITVTEVFVDGKWMKAGWFGLGNSSSGMFTYGAESYLDIDEIRVVSGTHGVTYLKNYSPNTSTKHLLEGLIRVHVWKI